MNCTDPSVLLRQGRSFLDLFESGSPRFEDFENVSILDETPYCLGVVSTVAVDVTSASKSSINFCAIHSTGSHVA